MAITNAQQYKQLMQNGGRIGLRGGGADQDKGSGPSRGPAGGASSGGNYGGNRQSGSNFGSGDNTPAPGGSRNNPNTTTPSSNNNNDIDYDYSYTGPGITDEDARRLLDPKTGRADLRQGIVNAEIYRANEAKRRKEQEKEDKARRKEEEEKAKKETRDERRKETKAQKKTRRMQQAAFKRFQQLDGYVDPFGDETTFANMSGEDAARLAGYNVNELTGPQTGQTQFDYNKDFFRDPKTGKIKDTLTELVNINEGKTNIFGKPKKEKFVRQIKPDAIPGYDFSINPVNTNFKSGLGTLTTSSGVRPNDYGIGTKPPGVLGLFTDVVRPETGLQAFNTLEEARNIQDLADRFRGGDESAYEEFEDYVSRNKIPSTSGEGGDQQQTDPCLGPNPPAYCNVGGGDDDDDTTTSKRNLGGLAPRFAGSIFDFTGLADGGRAGMMDGGMMEDTPEGGIMDLESGRQMYFLGKLVKKATRAVKKIAKSPFGKVALGAALFSGGGAGGLGTFFKTKAAPFLFKEGAGFAAGKSGIGLKELLTGGLTGGGKFALGAGLTLAPFLMGDKEQEDDFDLDSYYKKNRLNVANIRNNPYDFLSAANQGSRFNFAADGGLMRTGYAEGSKEPVAKETMPLIDMDGKEMDLRAEGGFVPLGRMERADDVPARLSKNEFVFTADAVRNAGEGDVDKGAEVMYNMMKNLESGGDVSEESQGLDGARDMFETSQRLEEVI